MRKMYVALRAVGGSLRPTVIHLVYVCVVYACILCDDIALCTYILKKNSYNTLLTFNIIFIEFSKQYFHESNIK